MAIRTATKNQLLGHLDRCFPGLTLALQLRRRDPAIDVLVLERNRHPVPEAAFKVGESTVECGAHYFADVLGLRGHLESEQLAKFGLRYFFNHRSDAIDRCTELALKHERARLRIATADDESTANSERPVLALKF